MKRLPKKYGSVFKLSGARRKPWTARVQNGYNKETGTPVFQYLGYFETKKEALQELATYNTEHYNLDYRNATVNDMWEIFSKRHFPNLSKQGIGIYNAAYNHIEPLQNEKIRDITTNRMQTLVYGIERKWQTKSHVKLLLTQLFNIALELDIVAKNYAEFIDIGKKPESKIHKPFTMEEIDRLFSASFVAPYADTVLIMIYSGMRPGELLALEKENVFINESYMTGGLKTESGKNRIIPIHKKIMPYIKKRYAAGKKYLVEADGKKVSYQAYRKSFDLLMENIGMDHLPHDCRHTFATLADNAGMNKTDIKKIMGHSTGDITERVYTHKTKADLICSIDKIS